MGSHSGVSAARLQGTPELPFNPGRARRQRWSRDDKMVKRGSEVLHSTIPLTSLCRYRKLVLSETEDETQQPETAICRDHRIAVTSASPNSPITENNLHAVLGADGIQRLVAAFYRRIPTDDVLGPMYPPDDLAGAEERLRMFLAFRFGGPQDYLQKRGHPALRARHAPFSVTQAARDRWMLLMNQAIDECCFSAEASRVLREFLGHVATFLINR